MDAKKPKRIPIHNGHLILAECAYEQFHLDKILFLPNGRPPHKEMQNIGASGRDRQEMVRLAIMNNPHFELDSEELQKSGSCYTKDTLRGLCEANRDTEYYFIIGGDSLMAFDQWKGPDEICRYCVLLAAVRDQMDQKQMRDRMDFLRRTYDARIERLHTPDLDISSTRLRQMQNAGESIRYYLPDAVYDYIRRTGLYQNKQ